MKLTPIFSAIVIALAIAGSMLAADAKIKEGSCCDKARKEGNACEHPCCVKAAKEGKACAKCNK